MKDVRGHEVSIGDFIVVASRVRNIAEFRFGTVSYIDEVNNTFRIYHEATAKESSLMNWYYHDIPKPKYCKVLRLDTPDGGMVD